jgi:hypothetical protein
MGTFHTPTTKRQPSILVGWAAGVLEPWPEEEPVERYQLRPVHQSSRPVEVVEALAAADGMDPLDYTARHAAEVPALLALTHHSISAVLAAALQVQDELTPSAVLAVLQGRAPQVEDRQSALTTLLAS